MRAITDHPHMRDVLLVRHGQTDWNAAWRLQGHLPVPLNERGRQQVAAAAELIADAVRRRVDEGPVALWSSTLLRATESAEIIAEAIAHEGAPLTCDGLCEFDMGEMNGRYIKDLQDDPVWEAFLEDPTDVAFPGGESVRGIQARAVDALWQALDEDPADALILVSHGGVIRLLTLYLLGLDLSQYHRLHVDNASITHARLIPGRGARFLCINQTPRLRPLL